jgi:hypothetical protein
MSLQQVLGFPEFGASLPYHQMHFTPPPLFRSSASLLIEARQAHAHLQQLRMVPFYPDMHMVPGYGQYPIPMVSAPQYDPSATSLALAFSRIEEDEAARARRRSLYM